MTGLDEELGEIASHAAALERFERAAEATLAAGRLEEAAACAASGAWVAWHNHPGRFASERLESLCFEIGRRLEGRASAASPPVVDGGERVLHVLTEAYAVGGHTGIVRHWTSRDASRRHRVLATGQGPQSQAQFGPPAPGVELGPWMSPGASLLERALALRTAAVEADLVVLHVHPFDVVPLLAFPPGLPRPPIVFSNHADHCFWLGRGLADVCVDHRPAGTRIATERRGIDPARCVILPLPTGEAGADAKTARARVRAQLGLPEGAVVALTVGSPYKFDVEGQAHLAELVTPVVQRCRDAVVLAVGPSDEGRWASPDS
jgi:hypothetical protein